MNTRMLTRIFAAVAAAVLAAALTPAVASAQSNAARSSDAVTRLWGPDRYATSLAVAEAVAEHAGGSLSAAVLVSGRSWTDAVTAAPLAGSLDAPVLLADPRNGVTEDTEEFMNEVGIDRIIAVGSAENLPDSALRGLSDIDSSIERVAATDKHATSVAVARKMGTPDRLGSGYGQTVILASGEVFADALSAGPLAVGKGIPILLTDSGRLSPAVRSYIAASADHVIIMGGTAAVAEPVESEVARIKQANEPSAGMAVSRVGGQDRFETATLFAEFIAEVFAADGCFDGTVAGLATGAVPADAFSSAPLLARLCAPLVLTYTHRLPRVTQDFLSGTERLYVFGGTAAVSEAAADPTASDDEPDTDESVPQEGIDIPWEPCGKHIAVMETAERQFYASPIFTKGHLSELEAGLYQEGSKRMLEATWAIGKDATRSLRKLTIDLITAAERLIDNCPFGSEPTGRIEPMIERAQAHARGGVNQSSLGYWSTWIDFWAFLNGYWQAGLALDGGFGDMCSAANMEFTKGNPGEPYYSRAKGLCDAR